MKSHVVVEESVDAELFNRLLADLESVERPRVVAAGGKMSCVSMARSILVLKREPVVVVVDADTLESDVIEEQRGYLEFEMRAVSTSAEWRVFVIKPELEALFFTVPSAIERFFRIQLSAEQRVRAEYAPRSVLAGLSEKPWNDSKTRIALIRSLTEEDLMQLRDHEQISEIRKFIVNAASKMFTTSP